LSVLTLKLASESPLAVHPRICQ